MRQNLGFYNNQSTPCFYLKFKSLKTGKLEVYLDTGMRGLLDLSHRNFKYFFKHGFLEIDETAVGANSLGVFGASDTCKHHRIYLPELMINNAVVKNAHTETTAYNNSRVGASLLKYGSMTIDYIHEDFYYSSFNDTVSLEKKSFGFDPNYVDGRLVVGIVWSNDLKGVLHYGDVIEAINGESCLDYSLCDYLSMDINSFEYLELEVKDSTGNSKMLSIDLKY